MKSIFIKMSWADSFNILVCMANWSFALKMCLSRSEQELQEVSRLCGLWIGFGNVFLESAIWRDNTVKISLGSPLTNRKNYNFVFGDHIFLMDFSNEFPSIFPNQFLLVFPFSMFPTVDAIFFCVFIFISLPHLASNDQFIRLIFVVVIVKNGWPFWIFLNYFKNVSKLNVFKCPRMMQNQSPKAMRKLELELDTHLLLLLPARGEPIFPTFS